MHSPKAMRPPWGQRQAASDLVGLKNLGPTIIKRLGGVGIHSRAELERVGAAPAYRLMAAQAAPHRLAVCYYLYSLEGALHGRHWDDFSDEEKAKLRLATGLKL
jgi:DNA transformation protein